jgi:hypothetical protein
MNRKITIELSSDLDFEGMVVDITIENSILLRLNYDKGINNIEMDLIPSESCKNVSVALNDFLSALEKGKKLLTQCAAEDKLR